MVDDSLRRRLEALNRGELSANGASSGGAMPTAGGMLSRSVSMVTSLRSESSPPTVRSSSRVVPPILGLLHRGDVVRTSAGEHLRIRLSLEELWPGGSRLVAARQEQLRHLLAEDEAAHAMHVDFSAFVAALPDRVLCLDLETCGLAGSALFLVGLLRHVDGSPTVELLLARDYAEEQPVLESLWQTVAGYDVLVTFNGKSFDWPMVTDRSVRHRLAPARTPKLDAGEIVHVDVLHHARRRWRGQLPDCRLATLEERICRRRRVGDIAGHLIPAAYAEYVRTGFEREMDAILYHNAVDLVTLLDLALRLAA
jgi:uncharacterized protein